MWQRPTGAAAHCVDWPDLCGGFASACTFVLLQFATLRSSAKVMAYTYLVPSWVIGWEIALGNGLPPVVTLGDCLTAAALWMLLKDE